MKQLPANEKNAPLGRFSLVDIVPIVVLLAFFAGWLTTSHISPWVSWHAEVPFFFAVLLTSWLGIFRLFRHSSNTGIFLPTLTWPLLLLFGIALMQWVAGTLVFFGDLFVFSLYLALCVISLTLGYALTAPEVTELYPAIRPTYIELLALTVLAGGVASIVVALAQVLEVWKSASWILPMPDARRPGGNLGQPNHLSTLIVMAAASALFLQSTKRFGNVLTLFLIVLLTAGLAITESRTGALGLLALMVWWCWKQPQVAPQVSRWWAALITIQFVAMFSLWPAALGFIRVTRGALRGRITDASKEGRMDVWPQLIEAALQRPWWGWGVRQTAEAHNAVAHEYQSSLSFTYSHNLLIDLVLWVGFPVAFLLCVAPTVWLWRRTRATQSLASWYGFAIALPLAVHSMLEFPFAYAYLLVPAMLGLGAVEKELGKTPKMDLGVKPVAGLLLITTVLSAWSVFEYIQVEQDFQVARFEMLRIGQTPGEYQQPKILLLTQLGALTSAARIEPKINLPADQLLTLKRVALHFPWTGTQYRYAMALALNGNSVESNRQLQVIRAQNGDKIYLKLNSEIQRKLAELNLSDAQSNSP